MIAAVRTALVTLALAIALGALSGAAAAQPAPEPGAGGMHVDVEAMAREFHERETRKFMRDSRHVQLAYAIIWALTAGYLLSLQRRQRRLDQELDELRRQLAQHGSSGRP